MKRVELHSHTHYSNISNRDSTNFVEKLIDKAIELNLGGIAITDHAVISSHVDAIKHMKKLREKAKTDEVLREKLSDFTLALGSEIYLVDETEVEVARGNNEPIKFYHLVVIAKNYEGHQALSELSSFSWEEAFTYRGVMRVPTYTDYFYKWLRKNHENIIISSACLGSYFAHLVMEFAKEGNEVNRKRILKFVNRMKNTSQNFHIELQPSHNEEQIVYNQLAYQIAKSCSVPVVITTDAHYLSLEDKESHSTYLKSQDAERETEQFYASTYLMDYEELRSYFPYFDDDTFNECIRNTQIAVEDVEEYDLFKPIDVPKTRIEYDANRNSILAPMVLNNEKYPYIVKYGCSQNSTDRTLLQQIEEGLISKNIALDVSILERINEELLSLWEISEGLGQRLANYYLLTKELVELMWKVSLVGVSRGSAGSFFCSYLLGICQINPLDYDLDSWRHCHRTKLELSDIDIDTEAGQRANILELVKQTYGYDKVINVCTFKTEGTASAIKTACSGMGISTTDASYISSLAVEGMSIKDCLEAFDKDKDARALIKEMMNYEGLIENALKFEGLICGRSVHASALIIYNDYYWKSNAMMKAPKGQPTTQFDAVATEYMGGLKLDFLTISSLDIIRKDLELLINDGIIEWQGSLKATHDKYIHPDVLDLEDKETFKMLCNHEVNKAFQFDSVQGSVAINKIQPHSFREVMYGNALMRLSCEGEQPIDKFVKHKYDINIWFNEMKEAGLNSEEVEIMKKHLLKAYGVASTQEQVMKLSMDNKIANFDMIWANKLRKAIAKAKAKHMIKDVHEKFVENGVANGNRRLFLEYVWDTHIVPQLSYSFSEPHICGYSLILMQEMALAKLSPLHWKVACLNVDAGDITEDITKDTDYGAIAKAIADFEKGFVLAPSINKSDTGFKPDIEQQKALYGLSAINSVSHDLAKSIMSLRPYTSFEDFMEKCIITKMVQNAKMINLIKAGCFNEYNSNRKEVMEQYIKYTTPEKTKLNGQNMPYLVKNSLIPERYEFQKWLYLFKKEVFTKNNNIKMHNKTHGLYKVPEVCIDFVHLKMHEYQEAFNYDENGALTIESKEFEKQYAKDNKPLVEWLNTQEALDIVNNFARSEVWDKYCTGSLAKWDMDSLCYYTEEHELDEMKIQDYYTLTDFNSLPEQPEIYYYTNETTGKEYRRFKQYLIAGVVVEKNKNKRIVTLNTQFGVVQIKMNKQTFTTYDKKTDLEASWFKRGTKLLICGYRREQMFMPRVYNESMYQNSIMKLETIGNKVVTIYNKD